MAGEKIQDGSYGFFSVRREEGVLLIHFDKNVLFRAADLKAKDMLFRFFDAVAQDDSIRSVVVISAPDKRGREEYIDLYSRLLESRLGREDLIRVFNAFNQLILRIREMDKFMIHATSGRVIMMLLGVSLAFDYRLAADNTTYQNPCLELGLAPKGGGVYFLTKMLGARAAQDILLSCYDFSARDAHRLGLVHKVVPAERLEEEALRVGRHFAEHPAWTLAGLKSLVNYTMRDLPEYLEHENRVLLRIIDSGVYKKARAMGLWEPLDECPGRPEAEVS